MAANASSHTPESRVSAWVTGNKGGCTFDEDPAAEGGEDVGTDNARSPAPDAAPEDNPEPDALAGDVDIKSGTGDPDLAYPEQEGPAPPQASPPEAGSGG